MSRRRSRSRGESRRRLPTRVLIYGEDRNDTQAIAELIAALAPSLARACSPRRSPLVLIKDAPPEAVPDRASQIAAAVDAERAVANVRCVFAHQDCDDFEPAHVAVGDKIEEALRAEGCHAHAVVPAWEIEAWWLMWPAAIRDVKAGWRLPNDYLGRDVGRIRNAKEELKRCVTSGMTAAQRQRIGTYEESHSPKVAANVRRRGVANQPEATSASYQRFQASVAACAAHR